MVEVNSVVPIIDIITKKKSFNTFNSTVNLSPNNWVSETESTCNKIKTIIYKTKITKNVISINPVIFCEFWNFCITNMPLDFPFFISVPSFDSLFDNYTIYFLLFQAPAQLNNQFSFTAYIFHTAYIRQQ